MLTSKVRLHNEYLLVMMSMHDVWPGCRRLSVVADKNQQSLID
jgi:hypothetical protein